MKRLTKQECFDRAWKAFVIERKPISGTHVYAGIFQCYYQHPNDPRHGCAVGVCLLQAQRDRIGDYVGTIPDLLEKFPSAKERLPKDSLTFLERLQTCHDSACDEDEDDLYAVIRRSLEILAEDYHLKIPKETA